MASIYKKGRDKKKRNAPWYIDYVDEGGRKRTRKGCPDKAATEAIARKLESEVALRRQGVIDPREEGHRRHEARPLAEHLEDWRGVMLAKGRTAKHANLYLARARAIFDRAEVDRLSGLQPTRLQTALASLRAEGLSLLTCNHHRASIRAFVRWARSDGRLRHDPMAGVTGFNAQEDVRHPRRSLSDEEVARLIGAAESGPEHHGLDGPTRAMAYRLALGTGFRANEVRSLRPEDFHLDGPKPSVTLTPSNAKNRRGVDQPISDDLARALRVYFAGRTPDVAPFRLPEKTSKMVLRDLERAGIAYRTSAGIADFHALRTTYISSLVRSGENVKVVQTLARHSDPSLTLARYAKVDEQDLRAALGSLPGGGLTWSTSGSGRGQVGQQPVSEWAVNSGREEAGPDGPGRNAASGGPGHPKAQTPPQEGLGRGLS